MGDARVVHTRPELFAEPHHGFAWIRMIGALAVIYGHSSPLAGTGLLFSEDWALQPDEGVLMGFFAMSGFQITESWVRDPHLGRFAAKRVLRLWPPMLTVTLAMALIIGPLVTTLTAGEYFAAHGTWGYIVNNAGLLTLKHELPGVFVDNPWPNAVNGSLWTLPMELIAYTGLFLLLALGAGRHKYRWLTVVALVALVIWDRHLEQIPGPESAGSLLSVPVESLVAFLVAFAFGVVLNLYRIPLSPLAGAAGLVVMALMPNSIAASFLMVFAVSYAVVLAGHFWPAKLTVPGVWVNGSYGVYVWGFPIQQLLAMAGVRNEWLMLICAAPLAYVIGTLSWKFIEDPTMKLRHYLTPAAPKKADEDRVEEDEPDDETGEDDLPAPEATTKVTPVGRPARRRPTSSRAGDDAPADEESPRRARPVDAKRNGARRVEPNPAAELGEPARNNGARPSEDTVQPRRSAGEETQWTEPPRRARPVEPNPAARPPEDVDNARQGRRRAEARPNPPGPAQPRRDIEPNGVNQPTNGTPVPNGVRPPRRNGAPQQPPAPVRNGAVPQRPIDAPRRRPAPAPAPEESALSKRLSGEVEPQQPPAARPRPPVRRGTGRHARPEPPQVPEEETRPHPRYQDRR
ncbi:acyltransferase family protein [Saccharopolyspora sp. WRP15-2]|uniref:Acyltransferase family protein n=1 Tax=Saccharopolyspora oryzae TaxID=2997343 RepID=A0ABT4V8H7_9PSEU|nr:acyltransferase [Saccharopolyspora oryzae]MDA3629716.1 acyltransferase family protein [Saccharopolyspora oryzae]